MYPPPKKSQFSCYSLLQEVPNICVNGYTVKLFIQVNKCILTYANASVNGGNVDWTCEHAANSKHTEFGIVVNIIAIFIILAVKQELSGVKYLESHYKTVVSCIRNK